MSPDVNVSVDELQVLLNYFGNRLKVKYPLYDLDLLKAVQHREGYNLDFIYDSKDLNRELDHFGEHAREFPDIGDIKECLLGCGILEYKNLDKFKRRLVSYNDMKKDVKFSLDTNLLYHRFVSNYELIKPSDIVLVDIVEEELTGKLNYKYRGQTITSLKRTARFHPEYLNELGNKRIKSSRKAAYIASREYQYIMKGIADTLKSSGKSHKREGENDRIIVKTLVKLEKEGNVLPVLLTADDAMVDLCEAEGLEYFKFDIPYRIKDTNCTFKQFRELIFNMAAVFGFVKVSTAVIFGEFRGKSANDPDQLKLKILGNVPMDEFERDLTACRRLMELKI